MENKCEGNKNKIILGDFNITMDKMDRNGGNETCRSKGPGFILNIKFANNAKTNHVMLSLLI